VCVCVCMCLPACVFVHECVPDRKINALVDNNIVDGFFLIGP
jgi:hypothetical protein